MRLADNDVGVFRESHPNRFKVDHVVLFGEQVLCVYHCSGRANDNSCPSGSSMWKYRSSQEASRGLSALNPSPLKLLQSASTSATWKMSRPQHAVVSPSSKLRMAQSTPLARSDEKAAPSPP